MAYELLTFDVADRIATITVNRPDKLNALNDAVIAELRIATAEARRRPDIGAILLTGAGRAFIAGADIGELADQTPAEGKARSIRGQQVFRRFETSPKPTLAAINGFALGGGCELALGCDIRSASSRAKLGQPEINLGIVPGWGGTQRLARVCGIGVAKELIYTGRTIDADEAFRIGLVNAIADPVLALALETAHELAAKSALALSLAKRLCNLTLGVEHAGGLESEADGFGALFSSEDAKEGLAAFVEKRVPNFVGR